MLRTILKGNTETPQRLCDIVFHSSATYSKQVCRQPQLQNVNPVGIWRDRGREEGEEVAGGDEWLPHFLEEEGKGDENWICCCSTITNHARDIGHGENQLSIGCGSTGGLVSHQQILTAR